jgi:hypothetical protein
MFVLNMNNFGDRYQGVIWVEILESMSLLKV